MKIVVCGPEGSGTRALKVNVERLCGPEHEVRHLSLPLGDEWWRPSDVDGERVVVITRRPDVQAQCAFRQGCAPSPAVAAEEWPRAINTLAQIPVAYWVLYEALVAAPATQLLGVMDWLGVEADWNRLIEDQWWPIRDENAKYGVPT